MKKTVFILIALLLLTTSCTTTPKAPDAPQNLHPGDKAQVNLLNNFVETKDGCYYLNTSDPLDHFICFSPRGSTAFYPLCNKPNCAHHDENCNAYSPFAFGYYNGFLYGITIDHDRGGKFELVRMNLDGSDHTVLAPLPAWNGASFLFHHGKLYIDCLGNIPNGEFERFLVMDLNTYESKEHFTDFLQEGNHLDTINIVGDKIYAAVQNIASPQPNPRIVELDIPSNTVRDLVSTEAPSFYASETTLYYVEPGVGFREYDLATGEIKDCAPVAEDAWWAAYDEDSIYVMSRGRNSDADHTLYFYSRDYQLLDQVELTNDLFYGYVSSEKLYFSADIEPLTYYINKSDIGSHELSLQLIVVN